VSRRTLLAVFVFFCLLSSVAWLLPVGAVDTLPPLQKQSLLYAITGVGALLFAGPKILARVGQISWLRLVAASVVLLGIPAVYLEWSSGSIPALSASIVFAMAPLLVVLITTASGEEHNARQMFAPALAGVGGVLFLLPFNLPGSLHGGLMLAGLFVVVILVALSSVWIHRLLQGVELADAVAVACLSDAVFLFAFGWVGEPFVWVWSALASLASISSLAALIQIVLLLWLLREMTPVRFGARYLVIPLLTVLEGYILLRPGLTVRMGVGALLLAVGAVRIVFSENSGDEVTLSLQ